MSTRPRPHRASRSGYRDLKTFLFPQATRFEERTPKSAHEILRTGDAVLLEAPGSTRLTGRPHGEAGLHLGRRKASGRDVFLQQQQDTLCGRDEEKGFLFLFEGEEGTCSRPL